MLRPAAPHRLFKFMPIVGRSDQLPDRELTYQLVSATADGRLVLRRHHREGYTGDLRNLVEYGDYLRFLVNPQLEALPESEQPAARERLVEELDGKWETCVVARRHDQIVVCRVCQDQARTVGSDPPSD